MRVMDVIHLTWIDSESLNEWTAKSDLLDPFTEMHSVGLLVNENDERYVLAVSYDPDGESANAIMYIPKRAVRKVRRLCTIKMN